MIGKLFIISAYSDNASITDSQLDKLANLITYKIIKELAENYWRFPKNYAQVNSTSTRDIKGKFLYKWRRSSEPDNKVCDFKETCMKMMQDTGKISQELYDEIEDILGKYIIMFNNIWKKNLLKGI